MDLEEPISPLLAPSSHDLASVTVFPLIISLKRDVEKALNIEDNALTWNQLTDAYVNFSIIRPLVKKYAKLENEAVVYACLVVRSYFLGQSEENLAHSALMVSRAMMCEILAMKLLRRFASSDKLVAVLTRPWSPLAGASEDVIYDVKFSIGGDKNAIDTQESAIEMAVSTHAKAFLSASTSQQVINDIYYGRVIFTTTAAHSILADNYKSREIEIYNPRRAPFLNHYRLRVPRYRTILEFFNFALLLVTLVLCLLHRDVARLTPWEVVFIIMAGAFALEEYAAAIEHGWIIYIANVWNVFDFSFIMIFLVYLGLRFQGLSNDDLEASTMAFDILACGACILFPRLAFFAISNNVVVLSLRAMISQFVFFIGIAAVCFSGMLFTLWTLAPLASGQSWSIGSIAWLMVQIWFGDVEISFAQASSFHPIFGPILMTCFAALANTLLLTILISILSNTVAQIDSNATQEYLFQFAISTIEGVKSDALFSYQPPFNIIAFLILKPISWGLSPRALHTVNVFLIRLTSFPILIVITIYERYLAQGQGPRETGKSAAQKFRLPRRLKSVPLVEALVGSATNDFYHAIFEAQGDNDLGLSQEDSEEEGKVLDSPTLRGSDNGRQDSDMRRSKISEPSTSQAEVPRTESPSRVDSLGSRVEIAPDYNILAMSHTQEPSSDSQIAADTLTSMRRIEVLFEDIRGLPVQKLKDEIRDLQDRQTRIEGLLRMLTNGMRNDVAPGNHRQGTWP
ncbi:receptor-activated Ca2+-permeable cation channel [Pluteus cervinus]|uniref:Receptor-activated Ca2+-permeable cation channel n=1 Tax=Pluteus cervinus TaxID=181527 RepID=A0ACD3BBP6_9AGAR|nr:receptor-activated Ca2+-permeable cation channel [Pluteus cervinus]